MKKTILTTLLTVLLCNFLNAQFTVNRIDGTSIPNNSVIEYNTSNSAAAEFKFVVNNTSADNLDFRIKCTNLVNNVGANFQLCFGYDCFSNVALNGIYPSDYQVIINAGENRAGLGDNMKNFNPGEQDGQVFPMDYTFKFYAKDAFGSPVGNSFYLTYRYQGPLSISQKDKLNLMGVKVLNTVVNEFIGLEIQKSVAYTIVNMQGQKISNGVLNSNTNLDMSTLPTGMYLLNFSNDEGMFDTLKIVKK